MTHLWRQKVKKVQGLKRRWLTGSMGPGAGHIAAGGRAHLRGLCQQLLQQRRSTLRAKAAAGADYFNTYVMTSYREYYRSATLYAAAFDDGDRIELQFLNSSGRVEVTTRASHRAPTPERRRYCGRWKAARCRTTSGRDSVTGRADHGGVQPAEVQRAGGGRHALRHRHREHRPAGAADGAAGGGRHGGGGGADRPVQHDLHQQRGGAGVRGVGGGQAHLRRQLRRADTQQILRRDGRAGGQHQRYVPEDRRERADEIRVHLLRVPRAADTADGHQRLGRDAAGGRIQRCAAAASAACRSW